MPTLDLKRQFKDLYSPSADDVSVVQVPPLMFVMIDGRGDPNYDEGVRRRNRRAVRHRVQREIHAEEGRCRPRLSGDAP